MIVGSLPFAHYLAMACGGWQSLLQDPQVCWFLALLLAVVGLLCWHLNTSGMPRHGHQAIKFQRRFDHDWHRIWQCQFSAWAGCHAASDRMFIGGCGGSTTCGIKVFRLQVLATTARVQISRLLRPHAVVLAYYNKRPVAPEVMDSVMGFFYLYILCFVLLSILLGMMGLDFVTAIGAATSISNVGPGLGNLIGANGNFATVPDAANG